ncbi:MAG TPA: hypothetical protein VMF69_11085 [Gemmataceae bacterium]|nr:hypothetical protein [Gemmataceae bacterium]
MWDSVRRLGAGVVGVAALLALGRQAAVGQQPAPAANANVYVNPYAAPAGRLAAPATGRLGYGSLTPVGAAAAGPGYGTLAASYANPNLGYGSLTNNANNSPYGNGGNGMNGYGMYGTQWMMNPYQGYLSGAADLTRANAEYYQTITQARLTRQETIRSSLQTRRAFIEEAEWERQHMPDPEKIRQEGLRRELEHARRTPPLQHIWDASALNALLRYLIAQQGLGVKGPDVPLSEETLAHINLTDGSSKGNAGLLKNLKNNSDLQWPLPLQREMFKGARDNINDLMRRAYKSAENGSKPDNGTISDLRHNYEKLKDMLSANDQLTPDEYIQSTRYLKAVNNAIDALKSTSVVHYFDGSWKAKSRDVAGLVQFMREQGLRFDAATPKDEAAYVSLYYSLASFDRAMQRGARDSGESER